MAANLTSRMVMSFGGGGARWTGQATAGQDFKCCLSKGEVAPCPLHSVASLPVHKM